MSVLIKSSDINPVDVLKFQPISIISLWEIMETINLGQVLRAIEGMVGMISLNVTTVYVTIESQSDLRQKADIVCAAMEKLGFPVLLDKAYRLRQIIQNEAVECKAEQVDQGMRQAFPKANIFMAFNLDALGSYKKLILEIKKGFAEELTHRLVMVLPVGRMNYFDSSEAIFSTAVRDNFLAAEHDMKEAGKCFALGRYTACVFHLMRVMEAGMNALGKPLGVSVVKNWQTTLRDIEIEIKNRNVNPTPDWKLDEPFYAEAATHFRMVKDAWRTHTMHIKERYDEERAQDIFNSVSAFMRHLATRLHE
jgi:hypothetical protein